MVVAPSIVFYVLSLGGSKEQYGIILSAFSFSSFLFKPVLGFWCDKSGYQFRTPYLASIAAASLGGALYFMASAFSGNAAVFMLLLGRFLGGAGAANSTLGFTYVATLIPQEQMTKFTSLLSMVRVLGMVTAPGMNILLNGVNGSIGSLEINPLNSVGIFLLLSNLASALVIYFFLEDPSDEVKPEKSPVGHDKRDWNFYKSFFSLDILLPILNIVHFNANFQLVETGLAPAASDLLGWGPVGISTLFGVNALIMFGIIVFTFHLSSIGVADEALLISGLILSTIAYALIYFLWHVGTSMWAFLTPFVLGTAAFPFLGSPTRSVFTKAVNKHPALREHQGSMQAIMSMGASVAGFAAPGLIATYVLRTPEEVAASKDQREFTAWALFAPLFSAIVLSGTLYLTLCRAESKEVEQELPEEEEELTPDETTKLLEAVGPMGFNVPAELHPRVQAYRRHSITLMGIPQVSFEQEVPKVTRKSVFF